MAQEPNSEALDSTKESPELLKQLENEKLEESKAKEAESKAKAAESKKRETDAKKPEELKLPSTKTKGLEGTVKVNQGAGYYAEILAYEAMEVCTEKIAENIKNVLSDGPLIILGKVELYEEASLWNLLKFKLDNITKALDTSIEKHKDQTPDSDAAKKTKTIVPAIAAAPLVLGAVADIAAFFKTNRTITARSVNINESALISAVANQIKNHNKRIKIFLPERNLTGEGELLSGIKTLADKIDTLLDIKEDLNSQSDENDKPSSEILILDKIIAGAKNLIAEFTEKTTDEPSLLERVTTIDQIKSKPEAKILYVLTVSQGGEFETTRFMFFSGRVSYLGGSVISYILTNTDGECLSSGNVQEKRTAYKKRKQGEVSEELPKQKKMRI